MKTTIINHPTEKKEVNRVEPSTNEENKRVSLRQLRSSQSELRPRQRYYSQNGYQRSRGYNRRSQRSMPEETTTVFKIGLFSLSQSLITLMLILVFFLSTSFLASSNLSPVIESAVSKDLDLQKIQASLNVYRDKVDQWLKVTNSTESTLEE